MNIQTSSVTKTLLTDLDRLDPITIYTEDFETGCGKITILCYGKAWTAFWGGMGDLNIVDFFLSCDEYYISNKLSDIDANIYDIDAIRIAAEENNIDCYRDDPWNDYEFMAEMYGHDMYDWHDSLPKMPNPDYQYLLRIIKAAQEGLRA